jgi:hypothetical protein
MPSTAKTWQAELPMLIIFKNIYMDRCKPILLLTCILLHTVLNAQVYPISVQVNVMQPIPPYLPQIKADMAGERYGQLNQDISNHISITLTSTGNIPQQQHIKLAGSIERIAPSPIGVSLRPDFQPSQPIIMNPRQMISLNRDMLQNAFGNFSENSLIYNNMDLATLRENGVNYKLPEGTYRVCVIAYDYDKPGFSAPLSAPGTGCAYFTICYTASAPQLIQPVSTMLQSNSGFQDFTPHSSQIQFTWTPSVTTCGIPLGALSYNLEVRQVFPGQTVTDAIENPFVFRQENIQTTTFLLDTLKYPHILVVGQQYIVRVKANFTPMPGSPLEIANQGYSQLGAFTYQAGYNPFNNLAINGGQTNAVSGGKPTIPAGGFKTESYTPGGGSCGTPATANQTPAAYNLTGRNIKIGAFILHADQATKNGDGTYSGTGFIAWNPLNHPIELKVGFSNISINSDTAVYNGSVTTVTNGSFSQWPPLATADQVANYAGENNNDYQALESRINSAANLINQLAGNSEVDFPLGLNTSLGATPATLAIMGVRFAPDGASMNVLFNLNIPDADGWLSLAGTGICINPSGMSLNQGVLYLPQDHDLNLPGGMKFSFKACPASGTAIDTSKGTYVKWDAQNGLDKIQVSADLQLANTSVVPIDNNGTRESGQSLIAHARFSFSEWSDWVASVTLSSDFEIAALPGFGIHSNVVYYDHSNKLDPAAISFPAGYTGAQDGQFEGLYTPSLIMSLPNNFTTFSGTKPNFGFRNFILDQNGVTTTINANNILDISNGSLDGWAFSIDNINIGIVQDNFQDGMQMSGQLNLPISSTSVKYTCGLNSSDGKVNYLFVVNPSGELDIPLWVAKISLDPNSSLVIDNDNNGLALKTHLNGSISMTIDKDGFPKVTLPGLSFQDMAMANRIDTNINAAAGFYFDPGKWSFGGIDLSKLAKNNDPDLLTGSQLLAGGPTPPDNNENDGEDDNTDDSQSTAAGFDINLSDFTPSFSLNSLNQYEAGVSFNVNVNVGFGDASVISGTTRLGIFGQISVPGNKPPSVSFDKIVPEEIILKGAIGPVSVNGKLDFLNRDPVYGDGIKGSLAATFPFAQFNAVAQFGTINGLHYWAVGGSVFLQAGVLIGPGLTVNGFGGGIYHNMSLTNPTDADIESHTTTSPGTIPMVPQANTTGLQAELIVAMVQPYVLNASLTLTTEIHNGGLGKMELDGNGFVISNPPANDAAMINANMKMTYDFENQIFDTYIEVAFQFLISNAHARIWMHGGPDGDYLYVGRPDQGIDNEISLQLVSIGKQGDPIYVSLGATAYFDAGTELPAFPPLPASIIGGGLDKSSNDNTVSSLLQELGQAGNPGFMFGADAQGHIRLSLLFLYAEVDAELGFDVALMRITSVPKGCTQPDGSFGLNNWYALGQLYAYFNLNVGLHVDAWFYDGDVSLVQEEAWAVLQAGLPNPTWVDGEVNIKGSALGGLISVDGDFPFSFGTKCYASFDPLDNIRLITDIGPKDSASVFAIPYAVFSVPVNGTDYAIQMPPDQQHSQSYSRTFRFYTSQFNLYKEESNNSDSLVAGMNDANTSADGLGSTLYHNTIMQPHTKYKMYIECYVKEVINGQEQDPAEGAITQDTSFFFVTGSAPDHIVPENVAYTYPIARQHALLKNEFSRQGHIQLAEWQSNILPVTSGNSMSSGYDYKIYFINPTGDTLTTPFTPNLARGSLDFQLPANLQNSIIYDMQVWVIPRHSLGDQQKLETTVNIRTASNQQQHNVNQINSQGKIVQHQVSSNVSVNILYHTIKVVPQQHALGTIPLFTLRFQTSQYNSFADKIAAYGQWSTQPADINKGIFLSSTASGAEEFDEFEINGYQSGCLYCAAAHLATSYPPLFNPLIPWDNNRQNDKYASDNLYTDQLLVAVNGIHVDLGAPDVRNLMHPVYTLSTADMQYQAKLPDLIAGLSASLTAKSVSRSVSAVNSSPISSSGSGSSSMTMQRTTAGSSMVAYSPSTQTKNSMFYSGGAAIGIPASYTAGGSQVDARDENTFSGKGTTTVATRSGLVWKRDEYIYADYQLLQQFAENYLGNQQNTLWMFGGSMPLALANALAYGNDVSLAVGEYGVISVSPYSYSNNWNNPFLTNMANNIKGLAFQPYPATAGRPLQFNYTYPFCCNAGIGSTVPEQFNYGNTVLLSKFSKSVSPVGGKTNVSNLAPAKPNARAKMNTVLPKNIKLSTP